MVRLRDLAQWGGGMTPSTSNSRFWQDGEVPWISSKDVKSAYLQGTERRVTLIAVEETGLSLRPAGGVAVVVRSGVLAHTFPVTFVPFECVVNQDVKYGVPVAGVDGRYLSSVLIASNSRILSGYLKQGATVQSIEFERLLEMKIPLPPLDEQKRIVAKLDEVGNELKRLTSNAEVFSVLANRAIEAQLVGEFTDLECDLVALDEIAKVDYGTRVTRKRDGGSEYPVYGGGGETFRLDAWNRDSCYIVSRFAMSAECVRYVPGKFFLNDSGLTVSTVDEHRLQQRYLDLFLLANSDLIYSLGRGTAQRNLEVTAFRAILVPLPSIYAQEAAVARIEALLESSTELTLIAAQRRGLQDELATLVSEYILKGAV